MQSQQEMATEVMNEIYTPRVKQEVSNELMHHVIRIRKIFDHYKQLEEPVSGLTIPIEHLGLLVNYSENRAMDKCIEEFGTTAYSHFEDIMDYYTSLVSNYMQKTFKVIY